MNATAKMIYDIPAENPDLFWATQFEAPDPVLLFEYRKKRYLLLTDMEFNRGLATAKADHVHLIGDYGDAIRARGERPTMAKVIAEFCRQKKITTLSVLDRQGVGLVDKLRELGLTVTAQGAPLFPQRILKSAQEIQHTLDAQRVTYRAMRLVENTLRASTIKKGTLYYQGKVLTSEIVRKQINLFLLEHGYQAPHDTIIACGVDSSEPHNRGSGPLRAHEPIIVDIFPQNMKSGFHGDATRTFCKGKAPQRLKDMYNLVKREQVTALKRVGPKINGRTIHRTIVKNFAAAGFPTEVIDGKTQGFITGTGHGIGLTLHEEPVRIGQSSWVLKPGHIVTVEPGLYYSDIGGVRIEDIVVVTDDGCKVLGSYPKKLEIL